MRLVIDVDTVATDDEQSIEGLLVGLTASDGIECLRYSEQGPSVDADRLLTPGGQLAVGWIEVEPVGGGGFATHTVTWVLDGQRPEQRSVIGNGVSFAQRNMGSRVYRELSPEAAAERRGADALAALVADRVGADLLVTNRPYLAGSTVGSVCVATPPEAVALVGLFLRSRGQHLVWIGQEPWHNISFSRQDFFFVGARELLPAGWRWFSACVRADGDDPAMHLTDLGEPPSCGSRASCRPATT